MEKITSKSRIKETGCSGILQYRYYVDRDTIWFNLYDICHFFIITSERFIDKFYNETLDCNKLMFFDNNKGCKVGDYVETYFINKVAVDQLEENQSMRHTSLNVDIRDLEKEEGLIIEEDKNNYEFKQLVQNIKTELDSADRTNLNDYVYKLVNTRQINEIIYEKEVDPDLEKEVTNYKQWLQEEYDPDNNVYIMRKNEPNTFPYFEKYVGSSLDIDEALDILFRAGLDDNKEAK